MSETPRPGGDPPDNAAAWDELAAAYDAHVGWPDDVLAWGLRCPTEDELGLLDGVVRDAATLVLGCGAGQDLVALAALGAGPLTGIDPSAAQLDHARARLAAAGVDATLVRTGAQDLTAIASDSQDLVVSVQALNYVADPAQALTEARRVLRPGGVLALSVLHPADVSTDDAPPYGWHTSWFTVERDWTWDQLADRDVRLRSWFPSASDWFTAATTAGLQVERLLEPPPVHDPRWRRLGWLDEATEAKLDVVPGTILLRARRPVDPTDERPSRTAPLG